MRCPLCKTQMEIGTWSDHQVLVEDRDEEDEIEVSMICPGCQAELFAVLCSTDFAEV